MQMNRNRSLTQLLSVSALWVAGCATAGDYDDGVPLPDGRSDAVIQLGKLAGAPVSIDIGEAGESRVLAMTPRFPVAARYSDPALAAQDFLARNHDAFKLAASDATSFAVSQVGTDAAGDLRHVTLQRMYNGIPVFHGAISVHMDTTNGVFTALGDEAYQVDAPTNRQLLSPSEALDAAARHYGLNNFSASLES